MSLLATAASFGLLGLVLYMMHTAKSSESRKYMFVIALVLAAATIATGGYALKAKESSEVRIDMKNDRECGSNVIGFSFGNECKTERSTPSTGAPK